MQLWQQIIEFFLQLIDSADYLSIFLFVVLEEAGPGLVLPGDTVKVLAGYRVAQGRAGLLETVLLFEAAALIGASMLYWVSARGGRPLLYRCARFFRCDLARLEQAEAWIRRRGAVAILFGRMIPGPRIPLVMVAGVLGMPYRSFLPALALGSLVYILPWVLLGMWGGPQALTLLGQVDLPGRVLVTIALFVGLSTVLLLLYRRATRVRAMSASGPVSTVHRLQTAALAGCLATFVMLLGVNLALYALGALGLTLPEGALLQLVDQGAPQLDAVGSPPRSFVHLALVLLLSNLVWALIYAYVADSVQPRHAWLRGLLVAPLPLIFSLLVLMPFLRAGPLGLGLDVGLLPIAGEAFRNALFGVALGVCYELLRLARGQTLVVPAAGVVEVSAKAV